MPKPTRLLSSLALVAAVGTAAVLPAGAVPAPGDPGIGDPYFPRDGNGGIDVQHYDVGVTYAFETRDVPATLAGTTTLDVVATQDLTSFNLDLLLKVDAVQVDGAPAAFEKTDRHELRITPAVPLASGDTFTVEVTYRGRPENLDYAGESNWLADRTEVVTMNEPHMAPWWFPSNDHPRDKATFDIRITTDADMAVISNGERVGEPVVEGELATTHWRLAQPTTTYLAYFAAGDFDVTTGEAGGIPWVTGVSNRFRDDAREYFKNIVNRSGRVTLWLQEQLGDYPFDSTGGLVTALSSGFALENTTRPTYSGGIGQAVLVHELAHQWFGDSVAIHRWRDIWLNEGFASYMEHSYQADHGGPSVARWLTGTHRSYKRWAEFWEVDISDPGRRRIFDWAVYERGAMALAALRGKIGARKFDGLLRTWAEEKLHATARVPQFIALAEEVAGHELDRFFRVWLKAPRPPAASEVNGFPPSQGGARGSARLPAPRCAAWYKCD